MLLRFVAQHMGFFTLPTRINAMSLVNRLLNCLDILAIELVERSSSLIMSLQ
jgi:hypothetical protein